MTTPSPLETLDDLIAFLKRQQALLREEGTFAKDADDLCLILRPGGDLSLHFVASGPVKPHPVLEKAISLDPEYEIAREATDAA